MRRLILREFNLRLAILVWVTGMGVLATFSLAHSQSWGSLYNMDSMLNQEHPFAARPASASVPVGVSTQVTPASASLQPEKASAMQARVPDDDESWKFSNLFSEIRIGVLAHDTGPFSSKEEDGIDTNFELLFASTDLFSFMWSPRPHLGISYNSSDHTSQAYMGLTWEWSFWDGWFAGFSLGGMVHNGHLVGVDGESKSLGCRLLFRESVNAGYRFYKRHALMFHFDHSSNANLCKKNTSDGSEFGRHNVVLNEGLENVGVRYGYMF